MEMSILLYFGWLGEAGDAWRVAHLPLEAHLFTRIWKHGRNSCSNAGSLRRASHELSVE
jgi:hypothetical protein